MHQTPPQHADGLEACDGAHHDAVVDDRQVFAFQEHEAEWRAI